MSSGDGSGESGVESGPRRAVGAPAALAEELTGRLRCASCRYELRGLSVKSRCPECGLPIQATLLSIVDPLAEELAPIDRPRTVAVGLAVWAAGALTAVLLGWAVWVSGIVPAVVSPSMEGRLIFAGAAAMAISGIGGIAIIRPHRSIPWPRSIAAACAIALYPAVTAAYVRLGGLAAAGPGESLLSAWMGEPTAAGWRVIRLALWLMLSAGAWMLRGNLRMLAARSLVLRAQRVDRQTIAAVVASLLIAAAGDGLALLASLAGSSLGGTLLLVGEVLVVVGASLMTLGVVGITIDTFRLLPAVLHRPLARSDVVTVVPVPGRGARG